MSLPEYQLQNAQALYDIKCYMYKETFPCVMPLLGNLAGVIDTLHFIGYVAVGQHPALCPLYCSPPGLENIQQHIRLSAYLETGRIHAPALEVECTKVPLYTIDVNLANFQTIVHWADYPLGYNMPIFNFGGIPNMLEVHLTISVNDHSFFNGWPLSDVNMVSEGDGSFSAYSHHGAPYPTHSAPYITHSAPHPAPAVSQTLVDDAHDASGQVIPQQPAVNLKQIMIEYPKWRLVLAYLQLLFRVAIFMGNSVVNPHEITTSDADVKANLIATLFSQSLKCANTLEEDLENVVLNGLTITQEAMLVMAVKWISQFIYDTAQVADWAITHHEAGFGLHNIFGPVLQAKLETLLENFLHLKSNCLRSIMLPTSRKPPWPTWHLLSYDLSHYPSPTTVHTNALEMLRILLQLDNDPGYLEFTDIMHLFVISHEFPFLEWCEMLPWLYAPGRSHLKNVFLGIERTEDTLASWLGTHGPNVLPDSIFITTSVLFGLVNSRDLMSLLEMILREIVKQMQLQQEDGCIQFLKQGGYCVMEEMMYRAQMEVSLYSKAIVNLCEELDARNQPASGCLHPNLAWLLKSNIQDTAEVSFDISQKPPNSPHLHEYLLRRTQIEVDMLYDMIVRITELNATDDDSTSSGMAGTFESCLPDDWFDDCLSPSLSKKKPFSTFPVRVSMSWPQKVGPKVQAINLDMSAIITKKLIPDTIWSAIAIMDIAFCGPIRFTYLMTSVKCCERDFNFMQLLRWFHPILYNPTLQPCVEPTEVKKSVFKSKPVNQIAGLVDRLLSVEALHPAITILIRVPWLVDAHPGLADLILGV
ncbi:uncharacterized protein F5891DRAFT_979333 [Suillus fuscotomentosus]|uniref:Uncharacterized protein n=1 Tax=Suillus fuscotomentosus TaxID=1912939 RepID=A0AAD4E894_9AGAM|nr:uncharacterized protein F5891DRAFT_979333 [Suillus fuscotomentosus]KAG1901494.1 hypothetical protein F5891DRAFT_979333 [Suillus fuscotomentosus]